MPQGGRYILCDACRESTFSLNLPWNRDGETAAAARAAGWQVRSLAGEGDDVCPDCISTMTEFHEALSVYDEFDDCEWQGSYCSSKKAAAEMRRLAAEHNLGFVFNPGGGQFTRRSSFNCQITTCDDVLDLNTLRNALKEATDDHA